MTTLVEYLNNRIGEVILLDNGKKWISGKLADVGDDYIILEPKSIIPIASISEVQVEKL